MDYVGDVSPAPIGGPRFIGPVAAHGKNEVKKVKQTQIY